MSLSAAQSYEQLLRELRERESPIPAYRPVKGPRVAPPSKDCDRSDCYFHKHYGPGCKATLTVKDGLICKTYRRFQSEGSK